MTALLEHEEFCLPQPGESEPRTERYTQNREGRNGEVLARVLVDRCIECGAQHLTEV